MTQYRKRKQDNTAGPTQGMPMSIEKVDGSVTVRSPHGIFSDIDLLEVGYYRDVTVYSPDTQRLTTEAIWDDVAGTVTMVVEDIPLTEIHEYHIKVLTDAVQHHLDTTAQSRKYDNIISLCSYASSSNVRYGNEGTAGLIWRDAVWTYCETVVDDVILGNRTIPTVEELIAELPTIGW